MHLYLRMAKLEAGKLIVSWGSTARKESFHVFASLFYFIDTYSSERQIAVEATPRDMSLALFC